MPSQSQLKYAQHYVFLGSYKPPSSVIQLRCHNRVSSIVPPIQTQRNIAFCRKESLSRASVNEFVFQYMNHNPLKQGSHYVNRVLRAHTVDPCPWIYSTGPEALPSPPRLDAPGLLLCSSQDTNVQTMLCHIF